MSTSQKIHKTPYLNHVNSGYFRPKQAIEQLFPRIFFYLDPESTILILQPVKSNLNITTGFLIRKFRISKGWDQAYMAARLDITRSSYSKIEAGYTDVNLSRLEQIAFILDVKLIHLLSFDPEQEMRDASRYLSVLAQIREKDRCIELLLHQIVALVHQLKFGRESSSDNDK